MGRITHWMDHGWYPQHQDNWDDHLFRKVILEHLLSDMSILDLGAGAGIVSQMNFRGQVRRVCGVDLDSRVAENPFLDEGRISDAGEIPFPDSSFDLVFSDNVLEHLEKPLTVFEEVFRVLKPGGHFLFKTPNKWHYVATVARLTPHGFHRYVNRMRGRAEIDTFPTLYRANTKADIARLANLSAFDVASVDLVEGRPEYLRMNPFTYLVGFAYERLVNCTGLLSIFRVLLVGILRKPSQP